MTKLENDILQLQLTYDQLKEDDNNFSLMKAKDLKDIEDFKAERSKCERQQTEMRDEGIEGAEKALESKKDQLRDLERELKNTKEGKEGGQLLKDSMIRTLQEQESNAQQLVNK